MFYLYLYLQPWMTQPELWNFFLWSSGAQQFGPAGGTGGCAAAPAVRGQGEREEGERAETVGGDGGDHRAGGEDKEQYWSGQRSA